MAILCVPYDQARQVLCRLAHPLGREAVCDNAIWQVVDNVPRRELLGDIGAS